jgi:hypothetical protein
METAITTVTVAEAESAIEEISSRRALLVERRMVVDRKIQAIEDSVGARYLESNDLGPVREIGELESELRAIERGLSLLDVRQAQAVLGLKRATAAALRGQADRKRAELASIEEKMALLLAELGRLVDVPLTACCVGYERKGVWLTAQAGLNTPEPWLGPGEVWPDPTNREQFHIPLPRRLRVEIQALENDAAKLESELGLSPAESSPVVAEVSAAAAPTTELPLSKDPWYRDGARRRDDSRGELWQRRE